MKQSDRIFVAGHRGLVGAAIVRSLQRKGFENLVLKSRDELDLLNQRQVQEFFEQSRIDYVFLAAARVGGIVANRDFIGSFLYENLMIAANVIHAAHLAKIKKLLFLGSSCVYPKYAPQPIEEKSLLTSELEPTNEGYAIAKIAGLKLCEMYQRQYGDAFISAMPTNLYGPGDNFHPEHSHVIPGIMRRFHGEKLKGSKTVTNWGTGRVRREFLHVDDLAEALLILMEKYDQPQTINVGTGIDCTISEMAHMMKKVTGFQGDILFDPSKPDGTPRKVLDVSRIHSLGWNHRVALEDGLRSTYEWALEQKVF